MVLSQRAPDTSPTTGASTSRAESRRSDGCYPRLLHGVSFIWLLHHPPLAQLVEEDVGLPCAADVPPAHNCYFEHDCSEMDNDAAVGGFDCIAVGASRSLASA